MLLCSKFLLLLVLLVVADQVPAYSSDGHAIVPNLAWRLLTEETKANVEKILARSKYFYKSLLEDKCEGECSPLGEFGKWADNVRDEDPAYQAVYGYADLMHYMEIPDDEVPCPILADEDVNECFFDYDRDCPEDACSVGGITINTSHLKEEHQQRRLFWLALQHRLFGDSAKESLLFLTHFFR